ncbi:DUF262 domain-containing protein [Bacteroidales bacterium OttesenSCG-928-B11]|nr:DUF262 domain-containing protein [Bacteroidales bacterium OttesenSCG-928-B11]
MSNEVNIQKFERLSFWQLLENRSIEIPIIQRDYAQGRVKKEKVRNDFLRALKSALTDKPIELDFVYGSEENHLLQPLDGQQRLTTLFLLHWFIANKEGILEEEVKNRLSKFTYETRTSSREFCRKLINKSIDYQKLLPIDVKKNITEKNQLSKTIRNASWFVISWKNDPTISAMLIMLDAIHTKFKDIPDLWEKLKKTADEKCPITFLYIKLENFGLSDDLYIKMNARGKQLTPFENFKSRFEKHIEQNGWEKDLIVQETDTGEVKREKLSKQFKYKIDTIWTDLFWKYKRNIGKRDENGSIIIEYEIDSKLMNFIAGVAINCYAEKRKIAENEEEIEKVRTEIAEKGKIKNITDDAIKKERIEHKIQQLASNSSSIAPEDFWEEDFFQYLIKYFDKYSEKDNDKIKTLKTKLWNTIDDDFLFKDIISDKPTQPERVLFYAQTEYLFNNDDFNQDEFDNWIRVVRNIVENAISGNWNNELMVNLIQLVHKWASNSNDIYSFLSKENSDNYSVAKEQIREEIEKAKIIITNLTAQQVIHDTEDTNFCKGKIDFALYCADYDIENPNPSTFDKDKLEKICKAINEHLSKDDVSNDFRLAFFTIQNNDFYDYWEGSMWYGHGLRYRLLENTNDFKNYYALRGKDNGNIKNNNWSYSKELLNILSQYTIENIISEFQKSPNFDNIDEWIKNLFDKPYLLNNSNKHYVFHNYDNSKWYLIKWNTSVVWENWDGLQEIK